MTLSVAIMGHPARQDFIDELAPQLPGAAVVLDRIGSRWDTGRRALLAFDPSADLHCVVQDDALACKDFIAGAELAARAAGARPVGLYVGKVRPYQYSVTPAVLMALRDGRPWLAARGPLWGVAIVVPTAHISEMVRWCDGRDEIPNYDRRIEAWYGEQGIDCWYTVPSLVDHRPVAENPSLIPGRGDNRQAHIFFGERSPLEIDWSRAPLPIHGMTVEHYSDFPTAKQPRRRQHMALRHYKIIHKDGQELVKLIDESHVGGFEKLAGVVSVEPVDDESYEPTPIQFEGDRGDEKPGGGLAELTVEQLVAVIDGDTDAFEDAGSIEVPRALDELRLRSSEGDDDATAALTERELVEESS